MKAQFAKILVSMSRKTGMLICPAWRL